MVTLDDRRQDRTSSPRGPTCSRRATPSASTSRSSATTRGCRRRPCAASAWSRSKGQPEARCRPATRPSPTSMEVATESPRALDVARSRCSSSRWSTTRSTARSATRRASARCRSSTSTGTRSTRASTCIKVHKHKVVDLGPHIVLDQERCILCTRCIRVCDEVAQTHQLEMAHRGDREVLTTAPGQQLDNPYSLNTVDVCPVGALTAKDFRFTMRAWELYTTPSVCTGCATGCNIEVHHAQRRRSTAWCRAHNPAVNKYWMCDEGRFTYKTLRRRSGWPRRSSGGAPVDWDRALDDARPRAVAPCSRRRRTRSASCSPRSRTNEDNLRARAGWRRAPAASARRTSPGCRPGRARRRHPARRRHEPEHRRRRWRSARAACAALLDLSNDLKAGAVTALIVARRREACSAGKARGGAAAGRLRRWSRSRARHGRRSSRPRTSRCRSPRGPRSTARSPTPGHGPAHARRACRPPGDALPAGRSLVAPGAQARRATHGATSTREGGLHRGHDAEAAVHEGRATGDAPMLPACSCRFAQLARLTRADGPTAASASRGGRPAAHQDACSWCSAS